MLHLLRSLLIATALTHCLCRAELPNSTSGVHRHPLPESGTSYGYLSFIPENYDAKQGKHPLLIFLHGQGKLGDGKEQLGQLFGNGPFMLIQKDPKLFNEASCIVLAPQGLKADQWWKLNKLQAFLKHALSHYAVDKDRIYLTGLSMGGGSCWKLAELNPESFAAIVPICGASRPPKHKAAKIDTAIWAFHSIGDPRVRFSSTDLWLNSLAGTQAGSLAEGYPDKGVQSASFVDGKWQWLEGQQPPTSIGVTVFPDQNHDSWTRAYNDPQLWKWLFAQKR